MTYQPLQSEETVTKPVAQYQLQPTPHCPGCGRGPVCEYCGAMTRHAKAFFEHMAKDASGVTGGQREVKPLKDADEGASAR